MRIACLVFFTLSGICLKAQVTQFNPDLKYHPDSLKRWTKSIFEGISEKHPGFYSFTSKSKFDQLIDSTIQTILVPSTELEYYRKLKPLFARIGCVHTGISLSEEYQAYLDNTSTFIPLEIFIDSTMKVFVSRNYDTLNRIVTGARVISINGKPVSDILQQIMEAIPSDGYNKTAKVLLLNNRFPFWYQTIIEASDTFQVELEQESIRKIVNVGGVAKKTFPSTQALEHNYTKPMTFQVRHNIGILKVHSFAKSNYRGTGQKFKKSVRHIFRLLEKEGITRLIVDLRYNTGGTDGHAAYFAAHFFNKPFRYWDKIEVTQSVSEEIKGLYRIFYKKPELINGSYRWKKALLTNEFDYYQVQKPARYSFNGQAYLLTNGLCLSSCSDFVALLSHNNKAKVIGQETGGGYQGNTSGMMPVAKIPTGLRVTVPLQKYTNAVDMDKNYGRGTIPHYQVSPGFIDWISKRDVEMEFVLELLVAE